MKYISNISHMSAFDQAVIKHRLKIIEFFEEFGQEATNRAFDTGRSTIYLWKQNINKSGGYLSALKPISKAPKNVRKNSWDPLIVSFIEQYRTKHPTADKLTVKSALDAYCMVLGIKSTSESTVGRIIAGLKEKGRIPNHNTKITVNGKTGNLRLNLKSKGEKKLRVKKYKPEDPGDLVQIDAITIFVNGIRRYIICAIDIKTRVAFALGYKTLSSSTATDFMVKLQNILPFAIKRIQTDNGKEFHKYFRDYVKSQGIIHFYNYPRSPKSNCYVERFNGLIQKQYVNFHFDDLIDTDKFNLGLVEYLLWYNTEKPHRNLAKMSPLQYFVNTFISPQKSNMLWTATNS